MNNLFYFVYFKDRFKSVDLKIFSLFCRPSKKMLTVRCQNSKIPLYSIHNNPIKEYEFAVSGRDSKAFMFDERMIRTSENTYCTKTAPVKEYCPRHLQDSKCQFY